MEDKWIKYFQDELSDSEKKELFSLIEVDEASKQDFSKLINVWGISQWLTQKQDTQTASEGKNAFLNGKKEEICVFAHFNYYVMQQ